MSIQRCDNCNGVGYHPIVVKENIWWNFFISITIFLMITLFALGFWLGNNQAENNPIDFKICEVNECIEIFHLDSDETIVY